MIIQRVFTRGNSQIVRVPKEFHIDFSELFIKKIGSSIIPNTKRKQLGKS